MNELKGVKILAVLDKIFRKKYDKKTNLEEAGLHFTGANAILNYKDGDIQITAKLSKKAAIQLYFDTEKATGNFKNIDFEKFQEKFDEGVPLEKIEEEVRKGQLPMQ